MAEQQIFFIVVEPEERITIEQLFQMVFDSKEDAAIALAKTYGSQNAVIYPPGDFYWHFMPPRGQFFAYPPQEHEARFVEKDGRYWWERVEHPIGRSREAIFDRDEERENELRII
jgi:hypothetical protein